MKKYILLITSSMLLFSCNVFSQISWEKSISEAYKKSKSKNMPIMIDVYTDWCGYCKQMDETTFKDKNVVKMSKEFVNLKINPEKSEEANEIAKKYGVNGYPTVLFVNAEGILLYQIGGYMEAKSFLSEMQNVPARYKRVSDILSSKEPSIEKLNLYMESGNEEESQKLYNELTAKKLITEKEIPAYTLGFGLLKAQKGDYIEAKKYFNTVIYNYPKSEEAFMAHYYYAVILLLEDKKDESAKYVKDILKRKDLPEDIKTQFQSFLEYNKLSEKK